MKSNKVNVFWSLSVVMVLTFAMLVITPKVNESFKVTELGFLRDNAESIEIFAYEYAEFNYSELDEIILSNIEEGQTFNEIYTLEMLDNLVSENSGEKASLPDGLRETIEKHDINTSDIYIQITYSKDNGTVVKVLNSEDEKPQVPIIKVDSPDIVYISDNNYYSQKKVISLYADGMNKDISLVKNTLTLPTGDGTFGTDYYYYYDSYSNLGSKTIKIVRDNRLPDVKITCGGATNHCIPLGDGMYEDSASITAEVSDL